MLISAGFVVVHIVVTHLETCYTNVTVASSRQISLLMLSLCALFACVCNVAGGSDFVQHLRELSD